MSKKYMYVYKYYPQYEESMALCEFENIFHEPYEKYFFTDYDYDYKRSVFIKERLTIFKESNDPEAAGPREVLHPQVQPLQDLRPSPRLSPGLRHLPYLLPRAGLQGRDPRRAQGFLVSCAF